MELLSRFELESMSRGAGSAGARNDLGLKCASRKGMRSPVLLFTVIQFSCKLVCVFRSLHAFCFAYAALVSIIVLHILIFFNMNYVKKFADIQKNMMLMDLFYVLSSLVTLAAGSVIIVWLAGKMVRPLENMNQVTRRIAQLDFEESVQVKSKDELGTLAASINSMSDQLKFNMEELQKELEFRKGMLRSLAHELKTPIAVIEGYTEHMPYIAESQPQKLQKYMDVIAKECVRMDQMIREILELCAYENRENIVQVTAFSSGIFLRELAQQTWEEFSRTVEILDEIDGYIAGDYQMLQRAVYNYIKNAVFHSRDAGIIRLTARNEGQNWIFSVYNSGSHIDEAELEKIWEVFYKSDQARTRERTSCGIGLAIAKEVAHAHRGRTWAKNMTDGVEFYLSIPSSSVDKKGG